MLAKSSVVPVERVERCILLLRGEKVILDSVIAAMYGVPVKILNQAVRRNMSRFPSDFMFQLSEDEAAAMRSHAVTADGPRDPLRSQFVTSKPGRGGRRYRPYAFTEQGVAMLSSVLRSGRAVRVNIEIMRAFVRLRGMLAAHKEFARQLAEMEKKYDGQFKAVFDAIQELANPPEPPSKGRVGFHPT